MVHTDFDLEEELVTVAVETYKLVVFNDDINTFDHVIDILRDVCDHTQEQAEQCTLIIHYKGKCTVKEGDWDKLAGMRTRICNAGISAEVME